MIYNVNLLRKEFRNAYMQQQFSRKRQFSLGVFLGLLAFAIYFILQTLKESVLNDAVPYLLLPSYFSTLYIYLFVSLIFNIVFFISNYEYMTFIEVMQNRWYSLVQLGYPPHKLISSKIVARILSQTAIYSMGYITTIFLSSFLKFPLVLDYFLSMYLVGLLDVVLLSVVSLAASLFMRDIFNARYVVGFLGVAIIVFKFLSNYFSVLKDRALMNDLSNLFDATRSVYMYVIVPVILLSIIICLVRGKQLARVYNPPLLRTLPKLTQKPQGTVVLRHAGDTPKKNRMFEAEAGPTHIIKRRNFASVVTSLLMIAVISAMLLINVVVLAFSYASPEKETSIYGIIPYVFQSDTMEPAIMYNDIAFFQKIDSQAALSIGDILLFKDDAGTVDVASLKTFVVDEETGLANGELDVDILNYPDERFEGMVSQTINRSQVYGVHTGNNRWFGAVILFANTTLGRLLLLLIPAFLIFFYDQIVSFFRGISGEKG